MRRAWASTDESVRTPAVSLKQPHGTVTNVPRANEALSAACATIGAWQRNSLSVSAR
jgi:hypothetical protein